MRFGEWMFDRRLLTLTNACEGYEIDLTEINSSAEMLDWIFQILDKMWADATTMHDLLLALDAVLGVQANHCSLGVERNPSGEALARGFAERLERHDET